MRSPRTGFSAKRTAVARLVVTTTTPRRPSAASARGPHVVPLSSPRTDATSFPWLHLAPGILGWQLECSPPRHPPRTGSPPGLRRPGGPRGALARGPSSAYLHGMSSEKVTLRDVL